MPKTTATERYFEAVGRRKTSSARVRITPSKSNSFSINGRDLTSYFPTPELQNIVLKAVTKNSGGKYFFVSVKISGGGINSQAEAISLGIARSLIILDPGLRTSLKKEGFLKRDPRVKERRKFGLKKARKAPQWSKR